jgi:predicted methyltransferase
VFELFDNALSQMHYLLLDAGLEGEIVVDATAGNGKDTLFLAQAVGEKGKVYAFDIQEEAIFKTRALLQTKEVYWCEIIHDSHVNIDIYNITHPQAVVFNLGYLPGGDHSIVTKSENTLLALQKALKILAVGGILTLIIYPGHEGGDKEAADINKYIATLSRAFDVLQFTFPNRAKNPPYLIAIRKQKEGVV